MSGPEPAPTGGPEPAPPDRPEPAPPGRDEAAPPVDPGPPAALVPPADPAPAAAGTRTGVSGTPVPVDVSGDRRARGLWLVLLGGPVIGLVHFLLVYLVAEAGCTGGGPGLRLLDPPVPRVVTLAATGAAVLACVAVARRARQRWRRGGRGPDGPLAAGPTTPPLEEADPGGILALAGFLLSGLFALAVLFVGLPALVLSSC